MSLTKPYFMKALDGGYEDTYVDVYEDISRLILTPLKLGAASLPSEGWFRVTDIINFSGELSEQPDVWAAVSAVWANRDSYSSLADLKAAMNAALTGSGYTVTT